MLSINEINQEADFSVIDLDNNIYTIVNLNSVPEDFASPYDGGQNRRLIKIKYDGTLDKSFIVPIPSSASSVVLKNDIIYLGGYFDNIATIPASRLAVIQITPYAAEKDYLIKSKFLDYDDEISISGGLALSSGESLCAVASTDGASRVIIQVYGIEETQ